MRVFVAGATGAIGRPLLEALREAGHEVAALTRSPERAERIRAPGIEPAIGDALDGKSIHEVVGETRPEVIVNQLTAIPDPINPRRMEREFEPTNRLRREATGHLMAAANDHGVRRLISQSVAFSYAPTGGGEWTEDDPLREDTAISRALISLEEQTLGDPQVEGVVLRYGFFYGPGTTYAGDGATTAAVRKRQFPVIGRGEGRFPFIHVADAAAATVLALDHGAPGAYNIVDDEPAPLREFVPELAKVLGAPQPRRVPAWLARIAAGRLITDYAQKLQPVSNAKAKRELGWTPSRPSWRAGFREELGRAGG
jgi:nucleoside-diphosphate-sugar epimerase